MGLGHASATASRWSVPHTRRTAAVGARRKAACESACTTKLRSIPSRPRERASAAWVRGRVRGRDRVRRIRLRLRLRLRHRLRLRLRRRLRLRVRLRAAGSGQGCRAAVVAPR